MRKSNLRSSLGRKHLVCWVDFRILKDLILITRKEVVKVLDLETTFKFKKRGESLRHWTLKRSWVIFDKKRSLIVDWFLIWFFCLWIGYPSYPPIANRENIIKCTRQVRDPASYTMKNKSALRELPGKSKTQRSSSRANERNLNEIKAIRND